MQLRNVWNYSLLHLLGYLCLSLQLDGNLLHTLCSQHGPVMHFMLNSALGKAFVKYRSLDESAKAQQNLNKCQLANTTITAEFVPEHEVRIRPGIICDAFKSEWQRLLTHPRPKVLH